jgi:hypothetical protein
MRRIWVLAAVVLMGLGVAMVPATAADLTVFTVHLAPPPTGDPDARGVAVLRVDLDGAQVCYTIVARNIDQPTEPSPGIGSAHIHVVTGGGVAVDLDTQFLATGTDTYLATGCAPADPAVLRAILAQPSQYYINIHTAAFPDGAVQGSLGG